MVAFRDIASLLLMSKNMQAPQIKRKNFETYPIDDCNFN